MSFLSNNERLLNPGLGYIEFRRQNAKYEIWDEDSKYLTEDNFVDLGLATFFCEIAIESGLNDMDAISPDLWSQMLVKSASAKVSVANAINELKPWIEGAFEEGDRYIRIIYESDRLLYGEITQW